jgi:hypothetical protein
LFQLVSPTCFILHTELLHQARVLNVLASVPSTFSTDSRYIVRPFESFDPQQSALLLDNPFFDISTFVEDISTDSSSFGISLDSLHLLDNPFLVGTQRFVKMSFLRDPLDMAEFLAVSVLILIVLPSMLILFLSYVILYWHVIDLLFFPVEVKCCGLVFGTNLLPFVFGQPCFFMFLKLFAT